MASGEPSPEDVWERYGLEFDIESIPRLCAEHGLTFPTEPPPSRS